MAEGTHFCLAQPCKRQLPDRLLFEYPIRDMQARGWIAATNDTAELESELCRFFRCTVEEIPNPPFHTSKAAAL
jgi:hypothetical protein